MSHYHYDHIGCIPEVLAKFPLQHESYDRGPAPATDATVSATYNNYVAAIGAHRKTATLDQVITLDPGPKAVTLKVIALDGTLPPAYDRFQRVTALHSIALITGKV